jgi:uncharacterized protein
MIQRFCKLSNSNSFFLFGARGVGKSTLLDEWSRDKSVLKIDLLLPEIEARYFSKPSTLLEDWGAHHPEWILIDEIQKVPALLNVAQHAIVKHNVKFAMTGSSARKLRRGSSNLLGGRAFEFHLFPFSFLELKEQFSLIDTLKWGSLPEVLPLDAADKKRKLYSYVSTYLKEEVIFEQIIRKIEPFKKFLEVAAQMNGKILNYSKIARDSGVEERSVARYYQILEDTLVGFSLEPYDRSIRKRQSQKAKFYFFDCGVTRALQNTLDLDLTPQTFSYGDLFEQFIVLEFIRLNEYFEKQWKFSYLRTKDDVEIDLVVERPGKSTLLIEIKSKEKITSDDVNALRTLAKDFKSSEPILISNQKQDTVSEGVQCLHWQSVFQTLFI